MADDFDIPPGKTAGDLIREGFWYIIHTIIAVLVLALLIFAITIVMHPDIDQNGPKILCTFLSFLVPMISGVFIARSRGDRIAKYVWISGLLFFSVVCVWVLDLPTGNGLCEACVNQPVQKLYRTFFDINHGSGLMGGDGLLIGTWIPLSMIGYAVGARFGYEG
jgi:hypothetical protein